jgi:hypothetical protein
MEDKRTEIERCNRWLRKSGALYYCIYYCDSKWQRDDEICNDYIGKVKEKYGPLVSKYLKSFETNDQKQRKELILSIINCLDADFFMDIDYPMNYQFMIRQYEKGYNKIRLEDPRIFWFRKLVKEDISEVEICRMLLTCLELTEYEIGISLGQEYVECMEKRLHSELLMTLVNKHIEVLQEELNLRKERDALADIDCMDITDYRDYRKELEEESFDTMIGGMYGDDEGDIDMDKLGY